MNICSTGAATSERDIMPQLSWAEVSQQRPHVQAPDKKDLHKRTLQDYGWLFSEWQLELTAVCRTDVTLVMGLSDGVTRGIESTKHFINYSQLGHSRWAQSHTEAVPHKECCYESFSVKQACCTINNTLLQAFYCVYLWVIENITCISPYYTNKWNMYHTTPQNRGIS